MVLELRPAHDPPRPTVRRRGDQRRGPVRVGVAVAPRRRRWAVDKVITIPAEPADADRPAAGAAAVRRGAAADHRHRPVGRRPLALRLLLGHRRTEAVRRERPVPPAPDRLGAARRHRPAQAAPGRAGPAARRRAADGRDQPRRPAGLRHQLAVRRLGRPSSTPTASAPGWPSSTPTSTAADWSPTRASSRTATTSAACGCTRPGCRAATRPATPTVGVNPRRNGIPAGLFSAFSSVVAVSAQMGQALASIPDSLRCCAVIGAGAPVSGSTPPPDCGNAMTSRIE